MKVAILCLFTLLTLGACSNTLDGAGRDIERAGQTIQKQF